LTTSKEDDVHKAEFVDEVARRAGISKREAETALGAVLDTVSDTLASGGEISFTGFGKFATSQRAARQGVNPRNPGQKISIPAARVPKFSAGSQLKQAVRGG